MSEDATGILILAIIVAIITAAVLLTKTVNRWTDRYFDSLEATLKQSGRAGSKRKVKGNG